jgi:3-hydroxyacyl-CoA dehydrogenase
MQVGGDVGLHVGANFISSFPERVVRSELIPLLNKASRLGEKTGSGFYKYANRKPSPDPALKELLDQSRAAANLSQACLYLAAPACARNWSPGSIELRIHSCVGGCTSVAVLAHAVACVIRASACSIPTW